MMSESVTDDAVNRSRPDSPPSRAPADQGAGSREQGNEGARIGEPGSLSPSTPPSSTSTRPPATVDGSIRPIEDTRPLRSVDAIRADLEHPHTAALTALHSTTIGDGPIGRLLRDVGPLLAEVERLSGGAVSPENRSNEEIRRDAAYRFGQLSAHAKILAEEHDRPWLSEQVAAAATLLAETSDRLVAALARIAAVEAKLQPSALFDALYDAMYGSVSVSAEEREAVAQLAESLGTALAASPTPTGPEPARPDFEDGIDEREEFEREQHAARTRRRLFPRPATPEPTEETP